MAVVPTNTKSAATQAVYDVGVSFFTDFLKDRSVPTKVRAHVIAKFFDDNTLFHKLNDLGTLPINAEEKRGALFAALFDVLLDQRIEELMKQMQKKSKEAK